MHQINQALARLIYDRGELSDRDLTKLLEYIRLMEFEIGDRRVRDIRQALELDITI